MNLITTWNRVSDHEKKLKLLALHIENGHLMMELRYEHL